VLSTIDRYLLGKILRTFVPVCVGLCFLFFVAASLDLLRKESLSLSQVLLALPWVIPFLLPYLIPLSLSVTLTLIYGQLVADNEALAFGSLGVPGRTLARPAIFLAAGLAILLSWLIATVVPHCYQQRRAAMSAVFQQLFSLNEGEHLSRSFGKQSFDLYVRRYGPKGLEGLVIHLERPGEAGKTVSVQLVAKSGRVAEESGTQRLVLVLNNVTATLSTEGADVPIRFHLERYVQGVSLGGRRRVKARDFGSGHLLEERREARRKAELAAATGGIMAYTEGRDAIYLDAGVELTTRACLALIPLVATLLVVPLTLVLRAKSALVPFALGLGAVCLFTLAPLLLGRALAETLGAPELVYVGSAVGLVAAGVFWALESRT
jgi:lipopolysaccharide export LptBFGC system permease protein LptF